MEKWAVVACDQYTAQKEYWEHAAEIIGDSPSTLNLILPEAYLSETGERLPKIHAAMADYLNNSLLQPAVAGFVYVERALQSGKIRKGLVVSVDLEAYDYEPGSKSLIRATEGTIRDRLPPRAEIRKAALLETPHIMMLIDDAERTVIEPLKEIATRQLYDFKLMLGGGGLSGWAVEGNALERPLKALEALSKSRAMLYAVGDGNHSLAAAKLCWEGIKKGLAPDAAENHPARFALVELMNIHDEGLMFEPIHRALIDVDVDNTLSELRKILPFEYDAEKRIVRFRMPALSALDLLQPFLDAHFEGHVDYIHGEDALCEISSRDRCLGIWIDAIDKSMLFPTVENRGALQKKSFSMGEAYEKRYYVECRRII